MNTERLRELLDLICQDSLETTLDATLANREWGMKQEVSSMFIEASDLLERLREERDRLARGMRMARARHLHNAHLAAEDLTTWTLNGNDPDEWKPDFGAADEDAFRKLIRHNRDMRAITAKDHADYLPRVSLPVREDGDAGVSE